MNKELQLIIDEQGISKDSAIALAEAFGAPFTEAGEILTTYQDIVVTDESQVELMKEAKQKRLTLKRIRNGVETKRKELKEDSLKQGRVIDSVARYVKDNIEPVEKYLELQEKFVEIKKAEEAAKLKAERIEKLSSLTDDLSIYNFDTMTEESFNTLVEKLEDDERKRQAEIAEQKRLAEEAEKAKRIEDARIREENEKLKEEAKAREAEEAKRAAAQKAKDDAEAAKVAAVKAAEDKIRQRRRRMFETGAVLKGDRFFIGEMCCGTEGELSTLSDENFDYSISEANKFMEEIKELEAEEAARLKAEQEVRERKIAEAEEEERKALLAPDREKIIQFNKALEIIRTEKLPAVKSNEAQKLVNFIDDMIIKMQDKIAEKVKEL